MSDESNKQLCEDCVTGTLAKGTPTGKVQTIGGVNTYVASPPGDSQPTSAILIATDVFGYSLPNVQLLADKYCENTGFLVVVPDLFDGDALPAKLLDDMEAPSSGPLQSVLNFASLGFQMVTSGIPFMAKHLNVKPKIAIFEKVMAQLREQNGIKKMGIQGYCYGGKIAVVFAHGDQICGFSVAHPSLLDIPDDITPIKQPGLFLCSEHDRQFPSETVRKRTEELLKAKGTQWKFVDYPGMNHGFAVRGNSEDKKVADAALDCLNKSSQFFKDILA